MQRLRAEGWGRLIRVLAPLGALLVEGWPALVVALIVQEGGLWLATRLVEPCEPSSATASHATSAPSAQAASAAAARQAVTGAPSGQACAAAPSGHAAAASSSASAA